MIEEEEADMKKITVLGAGRVGAAMAADLAPDFEVTAVDTSAAALDRLRARCRVETAQADLADARAVQARIAGVDLVIGAVPGFMGYKTLEAVLEAGKSVVDISFFPEDAFGLDDLAKQRGVVAVVDCGVAPGMSNLIVGYWAGRMNITSLECMVGGLPVIRTKPFEYKAPFSPVDVLEEYTRPARHVVNGQVVVRPALSDPELVEFDKVGTLESFNTDGLRSLLKTVSIPNMTEKTLRYPGHIALIRALKDAGFFATAPIDVNGQQVVPFDVTARVLFDSWKLGETEDEFTVGRIIIAGEENGRPRRIVYDLFDRYDPKTGASSMARTTGYVCTAVARLVLDGRYQRKGISPPEFVGQESGCLDAVLAYLRARHVDYEMSEQ